MAVRSFFWLEHEDEWEHDRLWILNNAFALSFEPLLEELLREYNEIDAWVLFLELRKEYFDSLKLTGMGMKKLQHYFQEFAEWGLAPSYISK